MYGGGYMQKNIQNGHAQGSFYFISLNKNRKTKEEKNR